MGFRYDFVLDEHEKNNVHNMTIAAVGSDKRVLDVGCSTGYVAEFLATQRGCDVHGLEPDVAAAAAARARLGDQIRTGGTELLGEYAPGSFDVVLYADVLEHLVDPGQALRDTRRLLAPGGRVVASIPNCAHGDVRLRLMAGHFTYQQTGLLDSTHLRFFTRHSVPTLFERSGYVVQSLETKTVPLGQTSLAVNPQYFPQEVLAAVQSDPRHTDFQFVVTAVPDTQAPTVKVRASPGWIHTKTVEKWASAFSSNEPVCLALPVADSDAEVTEAVAVIEAQCHAVGMTLETVADIDLVRTDGDLDMPEWTLFQPDWGMAQLRAAALPTVDVFST